MPVATLLAAAATAPVCPPPRAAEVAQNRIREKAFLTEAGLPVAPYRVIETEHDLPGAAAFLAKECPEGAILKRAAYGYDGKGQVRVQTAESLEAAHRALGGPCVLEQRVAFLAEASVIAVRTASGAFHAYDSPLNRHADGILKRTEVPSGLDDAAMRQAAEMTRRIAEVLGYVGVLAVEFFVMPHGVGQSVVINEIAPRVHNSGHWTLDACAVSQFENHIRAVAGWPIGSTERHSDAVMTNLLGSEILGWRDLLENDPAVSLHLYGKSGTQAGRKLGHVTRITPRRDGSAG